MKLFKDILRDTHSKKYSITKFSGFIGLILLVITILTALSLMIFIEKKTDHVLIGEIIVMVLTLLGYKNFNSKKIDPTEKSVDVTNDSVNEIG